MLKFFIRLSALMLLTLGEALPNERVMGGKDAETGEFPYQVSIRYLGTHICGGALIGRRQVLTAAQCVGDVDANGNFVVDEPSYLAAYLGSHTLYSNGRPVKAVKIVVHEDYANSLNDLAMLTLEYAIYYDTERVISLFRMEVPEGANVIVSGWSRSSDYGSIPQHLKSITLTSLSTQQCTEAIGNGNDSLLCLAHNRNEGICYGDMGGPAVYNGQLAGIAAFVVDGCGSPKPNVFTKVSKHLVWILSHLNS